MDQSLDNMKRARRGVQVLVWIMIPGYMVHGFTKIS